MAEANTNNPKLDDLKSKYVGTAHADPTKFEWLVEQQRESLASSIVRPDMLTFFAIAENESKARVRFNLKMRMLNPCGPPPPNEEDSPPNKEDSPPKEEDSPPNEEDSTPNEEDSTPNEEDSTPN